MTDFPTQQQQLVNYVKRNLEKGYTPETLKYALLSQGYSRTAVEKAIEFANKQLAATAPKLKEKPQITYQVIDQEEQKRIEEKARQDLERQPGFFTRLLNKIFK